MRYLCLLWIVGSLSIPAMGQGVSTDTVAAVEDTTWTNAYQIGLNFNQAAFSDNWLGGGINSLAFGAMFNYEWSYQQNDWMWDNTLNLQYGLITNEGESFTRKSQDVIYLDSKLGYKISEHWNGFFSLNFLSQFADGYQFIDDDPTAGRVRVSDFLSPAFFTTALGFEYQPVEYFWLRLSPFSPRLTIVRDTELYLSEQVLRDPPRNYGVDIGDITRLEWLAMQLVAEYDRTFNDNMNVKARYATFANLEETTLDHRLDFVFTAKLTQYINFNFTAVALYDKDQIDGIQFSQLMGIGFLLQHIDPSREE
ncbi:MAG: DUF3078 domain-containing protein [Cyclobacteriaceae bacterium]